MKFAVLIALWSSLAAADQVKPTVTVWTRGSVTQVRRYFASNPRVKVLGRKEQRALDRDAHYLPPRERNALFRKVGIETKVARMDEFDKDMLVMSAREYSVRELRADFPMLSEAQLTKLKAEVGRATK
jgi:hypothetical protein